MVDLKTAIKRRAFKIVSLRARQQLKKRLQASTKKPEAKKPSSTSAT